MNTLAHIALGLGVLLSILAVFVGALLYLERREQVKERSIRRRLLADLRPKNYPSVRSTRRAL